MAGIGYGKFSARQVLGRLAPAGSQPTPEGMEEEAGGISSAVRRVFGGSGSNAIRVKGHDDLLVIVRVAVIRFAVKRWSVM